MTFKKGESGWKVREEKRAERKGAIEKDLMKHGLCIYWSDGKCQAEWMREVFGSDWFLSALQIHPDKGHVMTEGELKQEVSKRAWKSEKLLNMIVERIKGKVPDVIQQQTQFIMPPPIDQCPHCGYDFVTGKVPNVLEAAQVEGFELPPPYVETSD